MLHHPHKNPEAEVKTTLKAYKSHSADRAYKGETFFWCLLPQSDDIIAFHFKTPLQIEKYYYVFMMCIYFFFCDYFIMTIFV